MFLFFLKYPKYVQTHSNNKPIIPIKQAVQDLDQETRRFEKTRPQLRWTFVNCQANQEEGGGGKNLATEVENLWGLVVWLQSDQD